MVKKQIFSFLLPLTVLKPDTLVKSTIKIQTKDQLIEEPQELAETFNIFLKEKLKTWLQV